MSLFLRFIWIYALALLLPTMAGAARFFVLALFTGCVCELLWRGLAR